MTLQLEMVVHSGHFIFAWCDCYGLHGVTQCMWCGESIWQAESHCIIKMYVKFNSMKIGWYP
uniref:Uncharacterized protein n=1 Tax=Arundo donax TaxID=35708 RepID=A0A0A8ZZT1_ARUDO